jgi:hypothetical protein
VGRRIEHRRVAVRIGITGGQILPGQPAHLRQHVARGVRVDLVERRLTERPVGPEHLEEVELQVPKVAPVVRHERLRSQLPASNSTVLLAGSLRQPAVGSATEDEVRGLSG